MSAVQTGRVGYKPYNRAEKSNNNKLLVQQSSLFGKEPKVFNRRSALGAIVALLAWPWGFAAVAPPDADELRARIEAIDAASHLTKSDRTRALEFYRNAIVDVENAARDESAAKEFAQALTQAPIETAEWERKADNLVMPELPSHTDMAVLDRKLATDQATLSQLQTELNTVKLAIMSEAELDLSQLLADAHAALTPLRPVLEGGFDSIEVVTAFEVAVEAKRRALRHRADMLEQRLLSKDARSALLTAQRHYLMLRVDGLSQRVEHLQAQVDGFRQREAGQLARRMEARVTRLDEHPPWVKEYASENAQLATQIADVTRLIDALTATRKAIGVKQSQIARYHDTLTQQLAITGAEQSAQLGQIMVRQRNRLGEATYATDSEELERDITAAKLRQLELEDQRLSESMIRVPENTRTSADTLTGQLHEERLQLLDEGVAAYRRYLAEMTAIRSHQRALHSQTIEYRDLLDRRLFWIPSAQPLNAQTWATLYQEMDWLVGQVRRIDIKIEVGRHLRATPVTTGLVLIVMALLVSIRRPVTRQVYELRDRLDHVETDAIAHTWMGIASALLIVAPLPMLLGLMGVALQGTNAFREALSSGLTNAALLLGVGLLIHQLCRPRGIAQSHFKWSRATVVTLRRNLPLIIWVLVPASVVLSVAQVVADVLGFGGLGRLVFAVCALLVALFAHRIVREMRAVPPGRLAGRRGIRISAQTVVVGVPLALLALSLMGYHFTAQLLANRFVFSACIIVAAVLAFFLAARAVSVIERRLVLSKIRAQRAKQRLHDRNRLAADSAGEGVPDTLELQEIDVDTLGLQTRSLVKFVIVGFAAIALWRFWADLLPALSVVDDITLWHAGTDQVAVTLAHVISALFIGVLSFVACRDLPGALEVSVLARLGLDSGTNFAITTIARYLVIFVGLWSVMSLLGARWSQLQWLVAALGVGLGFGLQEIVANFVSGVLILFERPIRVGDTITVGEQTGTVSRIRMRATTITDWDRKEQIIPNRTFMNEQLTNWTLSDPITRLVVKVTVAHGSDAAQVHQVLLQVAQGNDRVIPDPSPAVFFVGFGDHGLDFEMRVFIKNMRDRMPLTHELHLAIERQFKALGIEIPFPHRDLRIVSELPSGIPRTPMEPLSAAARGERGSDQSAAVPAAS